MRTVLAVLAGAVAIALLAGAADAKKPEGDGFTTQIKPYARGLSGWETRPILSVGDKVPETGNSGALYRMVGIPDGLGAHSGSGKAHGKGIGKGGKGRFGTVTVYMTHEIPRSDTSEPRVGRPAQRGAFASKWILNRDGAVLSGRRAFDTVWQDNTLVGPAADASNATPAFSRWCSAFLAGRSVGFDRPIFFANEETGPTAGQPNGTAAFDPRGSQSVAIFDNEAHALSRLGHFPRENTLVMPGTGKWTVILATEDGPAGTTDSQLYMYIGRKDRSSRNALRRNGLDNGDLYVFASDDARDNENAILQGDTVPGHFEPVPGADQLNDLATEAAVDAAGAFGFARVEDGMFRPKAQKRHTREFWFVTTGEQATDSPDPHVNELGRVYRLKLDRKNPTRGARLTQEFNPDQMTPAQDGPMSPDNMDIGRNWLIVQEDGTSASRPEIGSRGRDGSIWLLPTATAGNTSTFTRAAELVGMTEGGRDNIRTGPAIWESSGIIDTSRQFGRNTFLFDVQAHPPTTPPEGKPVTQEDGQLLMLRRAR